jgi:cytochrome c553
VRKQIGRYSVRSIIWLFLLPALLLAKSELYEAGKRLYFAKGCNGCHGIKAEGMNEYPLLANRAKGYLAYKLDRFRKGLSDNQQQELMIGFARGLSDAEIEALTTFLYEFEDEQTERYDIPFETWGDGGS